MAIWSIDGYPTITKTNTGVISAHTTSWPIGASNSSVMNAKEYVIEGQMFMSEHIFSEHELMTLEPDVIKHNLVMELVNELFAKNAIEFTKSQDYNQGCTTYRARIYAVPDTMVRILRENGK